MKCVFCGRDIPDDSNFCEYCGKAVMIHYSSVLIPQTIRELPENIQQLLSSDRLVVAIYACQERYKLTKDEAVEYANAMYYQSLILRRKEMQAIQYYCIAKNVSWEDGKNVIEGIGRILEPSEETILDNSI